MKKISLLLTLSLLFSHQKAAPSEGITATIIGAIWYLASTAASTAKNIATSDIAINIYYAAGTGAGAYGAKAAIEPFLAKYRRATNTENPNELHAKAALKEKMIDLDQADFQAQMVKIQILADYLPKYQEIMQKRMQAIKESNTAEDEKEILTAHIEARLKQTQENLEEGSAQEFEKLVASTSAQFKAHMIQRAKNR